MVTIDPTSFELGFGGKGAVAGKLAGADPRHQLARHLAVKGGSPDGGLVGDGEGRNGASAVHVDEGRCASVYNILRQISRLIS